MDLYFAGLKPEIFQRICERRIPLRLMKVLVSIATMTPSLHKMLLYLRETGMIGSLALDSGTFTLNNPNAKLDAHHLFYRYVEYVSAHPRMYDRVFSFDRRFTPEAFDENYDYLLQLGKLGIPAIPVSHDLIHGDYNVLAERGHDAIAIGQGEGRKNVGILLRANYDLIQQGVNIRHCLGLFDPKVLLFVPFTSVDASTATQEGVKRNVHYVDSTKPKGQQWRVMNVKGAQGKTTPAVFNAQKKALMCWLDSLDSNITWDDLTGKQGRDFCTIVNILFFQTIAHEIEAQNKIVSHYLATGEVLDKYII